MKTTKIAQKDFAEWVEMATSDPAAFEQMRLSAIEQFICGAPQETQQRLRRLQWRIDQERRLARTPMGACVRLSRMMWQNVLGKGGLRERFEELSGLIHGRRPLALEFQESHQAEILSFARKVDRSVSRGL